MKVSPCLERAERRARGDALRAVQLLSEFASRLNDADAFVPRSVTAAIHTKAMRASRSAYSTNDAPSSPDTIRTRSHPNPNLACVRMTFHRR